MFAKLIASASVYLVANTLYKYKTKTEPIQESVAPEVEVPTTPEADVKEVEIREQETIGESSNSIPENNPYYRFTSAVQRNTYDPYVIRGFYKPGFIVPYPEQASCTKVDPVVEASTEKLGKRVETDPRSIDSLYNERKRQKKRVKRKTKRRQSLSNKPFIPPTVEPTFVSVELQADLGHGPEHARHKTPLRLHRSRSTRRT